MKKAPIKLHRHAAFLRGINVGGRIIKMDDLKKALATLDLHDIKTIGASGNVLFSAAEAGTGALEKRIEAGLEKKFGSAIAVMVRSLDQLRELVASDPFKKVTVTPNTRLYVTFLSTPTKPKSRLAIPYAEPDNSLRILKLTRTEIISVVELMPEKGTIEAMELIGKEFGKGVTTRNWNTIKKVAV